MSFFLLLTKPALDVLFRDPATGGLKKEFVFVVDNGPAEQPACPLVQICLMRLLKLLGLTKVTQVSFAEYHSKRNFVERVHAEENMALYKHGPFKSNMVHRNAAIGSQEHQENVEYMCEQVKKSLSTASFGGKPFQCYRGIKQEDCIFTDEEKLKNFLALTEDLKETFPNPHYVAVNNHVLQSLVEVWNVTENFEGDYMKDYTNLMKETENRMSWKDKYTCSIFLSSLFPLKQPLPDYPRWVETMELHYLPVEERLQLDSGVWDNIAGLFIPSTVLDLCVKVLINPPEDILVLIGLLAWVTLKDVRRYYENVANHELVTLNNDELRETWKAHPLYSLKKPDLEQMCRKQRIAVTSSMTKHTLVRLLSTAKKEAPLALKPLYDGKLATIPSTLAGIRRMSVGKLRAILHHHGYPTMGNKDQLVIRVILLRQGKSSDMFQMEERQLKDLVKICDQIILEERRLYLRKVNHTYRRRTFASHSSQSSTVSLPQHVLRINDLQVLFDPLVEFIDIIKSNRSEQDQRSTIQLIQKKCSNPGDCREHICEVGAQIKVKWGSEELGDSGWRPGWYRAVVQSYDLDSDMLTITYTSEKGCVYSVDLSSMIAKGTIKLVSHTP